MLYVLYESQSTQFESLKKVKTI